MGARTSIQFKNKNPFNKKDDKSVVLFSHWGGEEFEKAAKLYVKELKIDITKDTFLQSGPLGRLEPQTVMVDFIRDFTKNLKRVDGDLYLGIDKNDGDNSDYGHHIINLSK
jgi:hypothetical protein